MSVERTDCNQMSTVSVTLGVEPKSGSPFRKHRKFAPAVEEPPYTQDQKCTELHFFPEFVLDCKALLIYG
eukprot:5277874-Amphidinium_carterae.1